MFRLALAGHTILGFDVVMPLFSVCHEAAAMGCGVNWGKIGLMAVYILLKIEPSKFVSFIGHHGVVTC